LLTTGQAGRVLGVSIQTIRNRVVDERLTAEKVGARTMVSRQAVLDEIEKSRLPAIDRDAAAAAALVVRRKRSLGALPADVVDPLGTAHQ